MSSPGGEAAEKRVGWAELLFDLVFVFAVTEVATLLHSDGTWAGVWRAAIVFVPIYWTWVGTSMYVNTHDTTGPFARIGLFVVALAGLFMALAVPQAYHDRGVLLGCGYLVARVVLGLGWFGVDRRLPLGPVTLGLGVSGPLLIVGGLVHGTAREAVWTVVALLDLGSPRVFRRRLRGMRYEPAHLTERFGLFLIIAIGESVVAIGSPAASSAHLTWAVGTAVAVAFALACGLWWVYFQFAADAMRYALATAQVQVDVARHVLSYGHLSFISAVIAVSVGLREVVAHPGESLSGAPLGLLVGGCALYLATFGYTRWMMFRLVSWTRLAAAGVALLLVPVCLVLPGLGALTLLTVALVVLNTVEYQRVTQTGFRALLAKRAAAG